MTHTHTWNIIDKKDDSISRSLSLERETYTISRCDCGATKHEYSKVTVQEVRRIE
ncbi:MAG: hypothetical protein Q4G11_05700 [Gallicola sp.]|nr:hypothetical protein [Gallicola sp.]